MAQRRFGPTQGAGVATIEKDATKTLEAAPLGVTAYFGILERGPVNKLIQTFTSKQFKKKCGGRIADSILPDACQDFWSLGNGAGELHLVRITDGTERKASKILYDRSSPRNQVVKIEAANGGKWGGNAGFFIGEVANVSDVGVTQLTTGKTFLTDEFKGGNVILDGVVGKKYEIVSNTTAGVVTVKSDLNMDLDLGVGTDKGYALEMPRNTAKEITVEVADGENDPSNEWSLSVYVNGEFIKKYANLSMDPNSKNYFVRIINDDTGNDEIFVTDLNAPSSVTTFKRPANESGKTASVTSTVLTAQIHEFRVTISPTGANPTVTLGATTDTMKYRDRVRIVMTAALNYDMFSLDMSPGTKIGTSTGLGPSVMTSPFHPPITLVQGTTILANADEMVLDYVPFEPNALVGGFLTPDITNAPNKLFRISANDHKTITIASGDLVADGSAATNDLFRVIWRQYLGGTGRTFGTDGIALITDAAFTAAMQADTTKLRTLVGQNKGLVKFATPGKTSTTVQKQGALLAEAMNWQYRYEIPDTVVTEDTAVSQINSTLGRNDFCVVEFPSFCDVDDPDKPGQLKRISMTGMIHGREASIAKAYDGYHKAAAGVSVTLPRVVQVPATELNEEILNPQGVNVIKKNKGNFVIWGDRTCSIDPTWKFKHQREQMSHYENRLRDGMDFTIFEINDSINDNMLLATLQTFFLPEFQKRALRGDDFEEACAIKLDDEINTDAVRANAETKAEISLKLADTVERFIITMGKAGLFESVG